MAVLFFECHTIESKEGGGLEQTCRLSHLSVHLSICLSSETMTDWIWMPFGVVSGVGRGMGVLGGLDRQRGKGSCACECGESHCIQQGLCGIVVRNCVNRSRRRSQLQRA